MAKIKNIFAREILDGRAYPTVEAKVVLDNGLSGRASVPAGVYQNIFEAKELRDLDNSRLEGRGVVKVVAAINEIIAPALRGQNPLKQREIDDLLIALDGTEDKSRLGVNTIFAVSAAVARAAANFQKQELFNYLNELMGGNLPKALPKPIFTLFNGGLYADTNLDFQEFLLLTKKDSASENVRLGVEVYHALGRILVENGLDADVGAKGGYAPNLDSSIQAIEMSVAALANAGYSSGDTSLGIDIGASLFYDQAEKKYIFPLDNSCFSKDSLINIYNEWLRRYGVEYLEDPFTEEAWSDWQDLTTELGSELILAGDDLFASRADRFRLALKEKAANAIVIKPSQIGTLSEAIDCLKLAKKYGYQVIISARGSETNDDFIVDFATAGGAQWLKAGAPARGERSAKYNRLLEIEAILHEQF